MFPLDDFPYQSGEPLQDVLAPAMASSQCLCRQRSMRGHAREAQAAQANGCMVWPRRGHGRTVQCNEHHTGPAFRRAEPDSAGRGAGCQEAPRTGAAPINRALVPGEKAGPPPINEGTPAWFPPRRDQ